MSFAQKGDTFSIDELELKYNEITVLYDYAAELVETAESKFVTSPDAQLNIVEPLINEIGEATDALTSEFIFIAESVRSKGPSKASRMRIESSLRRIYAAISDYRERVKDVTKRSYDTMMNIADPIVNKIQRQVERVVVIFLEFIQLSLNNIMHKSDLDLLRQREARVALMMHQMAQTQ